MPSPSRLKIEFERIINVWDGFGVNYVETSMTRDYDRNPQDYGGLSLLSDRQRAEVIRLIFGDDGLKPSLVKMFLDPFHQHTPDNSPRIDSGCYDHEKTTRWMRYFAREGLRLTRTRGDGLNVITTMYAPPAWMTLQRIVRGRDLDPAFKRQCARYIASFALFLKEYEHLPVNYVSLHNEGEDHWRWPDDGTDGSETLIHDYNLYWSPEMVAEFIPLVRETLDANGMHGVKVSCGETTSWTSFSNWGYADAIADSPEACSCLGLITSHGFAKFNWNRWWSDWRSTGIELVRRERPDLHAWVTSTSWAKMDARFIWEIYNNIYGARVNGIIPWACIQNHSAWFGGDPNPGCAILVESDGTCSVQPGYHFYKQVSRPGQPGVGIARIRTSEALIGLIGFSSNGTRHPDSFVLINASEEDREISLEVTGTEATTWTAHRSSPGELHVKLDVAIPTTALASYVLPAMSVTTFTGCTSTAHYGPPDKAAP